MTGCSISVVTGSMDVSVQPAGGVSLTVQLLRLVTNTLCVPPLAGNVSVVVNGGFWPWGNCCALAPFSGAGMIPSSLIGAQSTTTANVVPGAGAGDGVPVTTFVTSSCAQLVTLPSCAGAIIPPSAGASQGIPSLPAPAGMALIAIPTVAAPITNTPATIPRTPRAALMLSTLLTAQPDEDPGTLAPGVTRRTGRQRRPARRSATSANPASSRR